MANTFDTHVIFIFLNGRPEGCPIDVLKVDMEFIRNMNKDEKSLKLVELVIDISDFLDVPVIAEGVEEKAQVDILREMGCEIIQGYYFSKPVPSGEFEVFIRKELDRRAGT